MSFPGKNTTKKFEAKQYDYTDIIIIIPTIIRGVYCNNINNNNIYCNNGSENDVVSHERVQVIYYYNIILIFPKYLYTSYKQHILHTLGAAVT